MSSKLDGLVPPETLERFRHLLKRDKTGTIRGIMVASGISYDSAVDQLFHTVKLGLVRLLEQPNGEVLIDYLPTPEQSNEILVDAEVNRILKGHTTLERAPAEVLKGRTFSEGKKRK